MSVQGDIFSKLISFEISTFLMKKFGNKGGRVGVAHTSIFDTSPKKRPSQLPQCFSSPKTRHPFPFKFHGARTTRLSSSPAL